MHIFGHVKLLLLSLCTFVETRNLNIPLNGIWQLRNSNGSISITATVPGSMYTALEDNNIIGDPYFRFNDVEQRWASYDDWTYSRTFNVDEFTLKQHNIRLLCGGLDTIATIYVNDQIVGTADNQFRRWEYDIKQIVKSGPNTIAVAFKSPVKYALALSQLAPYPIPDVGPNVCWNGEPHINFIRKCQCSFSWDWGPAFPTMGIWRNITIDAFDTPRFRYVSPRVSKGSGDIEWYVDVYVEFAVCDDQQYAHTLYMAVAQFPEETHARAFITVDKHNLNTTLRIQVPKGMVKTWWPNEYGDQPMYDISVEFVNANKLVKIGFRTVELVQQPVDNSTGLSFYFKINGVPIFMKGSNWIPADSFQERIKTAYVRRLLQSAKEAHMNMMRINGIGIYESEEFYSLCDEMGILIWQDLMFACALYPSTEDFITSVKEELRHQVLRLQHHPSIALWSGNNENEVGLQQGWYSKYSKYYQTYVNDYVALYKDAAWDVISKLDPSRPFIPSSPSNGVESMQHNFLAKNPADTHYGDVHWYDYTNDGWDWKIYPKSRFQSEFGYVAWASFETISKISIKEDWNYNSNFTYHRQHHPDGNKQILEETGKHLTIPAIRDPVQQFKAVIYISQINQAMGVKTGVELYRRLQDQIIDGQGMNMGTLYWQLNDIWQAPSWASIEYGGKWKMLHYYAVDFYNRSIVSPYKESDGTTISVYYIEDKMPSTLTKQNDKTVYFKPAHDEQSDKSMEQQNHTITMQVFSWASLKPVYSKTDAFTFTGGSATMKVLGFNMTEASAKSAGCSSLAHCLVYFYIDDLDTGPTNWLTGTEIKHAVGMKKPNIKISNFEKVDSRTFSFIISMDAIAPFVWMEVIGIQGRFDANGFMMVQPQRHNMFYAWEDTTIEQLQHSISIMSLMDIY